MLKKEVDEMGQQRKGLDSKTSGLEQLVEILKNRNDVYMWMYSHFLCLNVSEYRPLAGVKARLMQKIRIN